MWNDHNPLSGAIFEKAVLKHSKHLFPPTEKWKTVSQQIQGLNSKKRSSIYEDSNQPLDLIPNNVGGNHPGKVNGPWYKRIWWWDPPQDSLPVQFCHESSIHGLKFMAKPKQHFSERIFWIIAFILGLFAAVYLINDVWTRYYENPVIVTFQPKDVDIDNIPFPAITICNLNKFPKKMVLALEKLAAETTDDDEKHDALKKLGFVRNVCNAQHSFANVFNFAATRGKANDKIGKETIDEDDQEDMLAFIFKESIPCSNLTRLCMFAETKRNCSDIFKPVVTDYGKCCTFNLLPQPLLVRDLHDHGDNIVIHNSTTPGMDKWSYEEIMLWQEWNYEKDGMVIDKELKRPYRQKRAGVPYGLSILLDANVDDYYCPASDGVGFRFITHSPLEMPHVMDFANVIGMGKEVYVEINPEVINADDEVRDFTQESRQCVFGNERVLKFFKPYTGTNCVDECTAKVINEHCNCSFWHMPRDEGVRTCATESKSKDAKCIGSAKVGLLDTLKLDCGHCDNLCEDIIYHFQQTEAALQNANVLWRDPSPSLFKNKIREDAIPDWANHKMSIVHVYFGSDTTVPKLRKRLYGDTDLIASTGGVLGLCLGVSVLSAVEAIYFFTFRACFKFCRRKQNRKKFARKLSRILTGHHKKQPSTRTVILDPNRVQLYPANFIHNQVNAGRYPKIHVVGTPMSY